MNRKIMARRGFALQMAMLISTILLVYGGFLVFNTRIQNDISVSENYRLQAYLTSKAGIQQTVLKVKLMQRELYDDICLMQGRNPLFDFSKKIDATNPGPIYLYHRGEADGHDFFTANLDAKLQNCVTKPSTWLDCFKNDLNSEWEFGVSEKKRVLTLQDLPSEIRSLMRDPFQASYKIQDLKIIAQNTTENAKSVVQDQFIAEIEVGAEVKSSHDAVFRHSVRHTLRVSGG
ncbi:MAG: hypothetical protein HQM08_15315 [Candidatus Riflebacteria bacterium]|nr:hypothetical protein [Candidatus Riflebacteria bacterium]